MSTSDADFHRLLQRWELVPTKTISPFEFANNREGSLGKWCQETSELPRDALQRLHAADEADAMESVKRAAATVFAYCYSHLEPFAESLESHNAQLEWYRQHSIGEDLAALSDYANSQIAVSNDLLRLRRELGARNVQPTGIESESLASYVHVMLAAAQLVLWANHPSGELRDLREPTARAFQLIMEGRLADADQYSREPLTQDNGHISGNALGLLSCLASAIVCYSHAHMTAEFLPQHARDYCMMLTAYAKALDFIGKLDCALCDLKVPPFAPEGLKDPEDLERIISVWEQIKTRPDNVSNWQQALDDLRILYSTICEEGSDLDDITDPPPMIYFPAQYEFCKREMSQEELRAERQRERLQRHDERMRVDFFFGLWDDLEDETKRQILHAELAWYEGFARKAVPESAMLHYSNALEKELRAILLRSDKISKCVDGILQAQRTPKGNYQGIKLGSKNSPTLSLGDMGILLRTTREPEGEGAKQVTAIRQEIEALPRHADGRSFLTGSFADRIDDIWLCRHISAHAIEGHAFILSRISELREEILGIGRSGMLAQLVEIKRQIRSPSAK